MYAGFALKAVRIFQYCFFSLSPCPVVFSLHLASSLLLPRGYLSLFLFLSLDKNRHPPTHHFTPGTSLSHPHYIQLTKLKSTHTYTPYTHSLHTAMGRKKIQIKTITDERNRQVSFNTLLIHCQTYLSLSFGPWVRYSSYVSLSLNQRASLTVFTTLILTQDNMFVD